MSLPNNAFSTYAAIGNREDLSDDIFRVEQEQTPFFTMCDKVKASAVNHEWQTQALAAADSDNAVLEGDDATTDAVTATVRLGNICQISDKVARVTGTQQAVEHAGRDDELAYEEMLKGLELRRDIEKILVGANQAKNAGAVGTARRTASVLSWIKTNTDHNGTDPSTADGAGTRTDGTQRAFKESQLKTALKERWESGGNGRATVMVGGFNKQVFSTFTGRSTPTEDAKSKTIVANVDAYESDFGKIKVVANPHMRSRDCLILQNDMWAIAHLNGRKMVSIPLAVTGDSRRRQMLSEYALEARNEKASAGVFDLTDA